MTARRERLEFMEQLASAFDGIVYDVGWQSLYRLLRPFLDSYNIDIFTLNYDLVSDAAIFALSVITGKKWFDGFGDAIDMDLSAGFRSDQYAMWEASPLYITLAHIHGSLRFAYHRSDMRMAHAVPIELVSAQSIESARATWARFHKVALQEPCFDFYGVAPIVSGLRKSEKLNVQPYANYFYGFAKAISSSPNLLIVGYGAGDDHINYWLREFTLIHSGQGRVIEVTDQTNPESFTIQRFGAYNLLWEPGPQNGLFVNRMGVPCITSTRGLALRETLPTELFLRHLSS